MQLGDTPVRLRMRSRHAAVVALFCLGSVQAQTSLTGSNFLLKSANSATLSSNGYIGTYLVVPAGGSTVNFTVNATAGSGATANPHMNLVIADSKFGFSVGSTSATNYTTNDVFLPAGTYFVRNERDYAGNVGVTRNFGVNSIAVNTVSGGAASFSNLSGSATINATTAANTYINNFRKGNANVALRGPGNIPLLQGAQVNVDLARHAFNFGGTVSGVNTSDSKYMLGSNPAVGSEAYKFQQFINANFNTIVPSNGGKWAYNEATQNNVTMQMVDQTLAYAESHNQRARMHTLIWGTGTNSGNQEPAFVKSLISSAAAGNATAKTNLSSAITSRINYYAGTTGNRSQKYIEIDGLNESLHNPAYWNIYGTSGIANIYNQLAGAMTAAGSDAKSYINEWNVVQYSPSTIDTAGTGSGFDQYANWYRAHAENILGAGGALGGIGIQYYASLTQTGSQAHSAATIEKALQNLSTVGLPISMTEFGMASGTTKENSQALGPAVLEDSMRMFFGNPNATTFMIWGWWDLSTAAYAPAALLDNSQGNNVLTPMGVKWQQLMAEWDTNLNATVGANGAIAFNGFYGDYNLAGNAMAMEFQKGTGSYTVNLANPSNWSKWNVAQSGSWSNAANWTSGGSANLAGQTAYFGPAAAARTVTVNGTVTAGMLALDSSNPYTLNTGTINLEGFNVAGGNVAAIYVAAGSHSINAALNLLDDTTITVVPGAANLSITNLQPTSVALTKSGAGRLSVNRVKAGALNIQAGTVETSGGVNVVSDLQITAGATLNLVNQSLVIDYAGATPLPQIKLNLASGFNGGSWNGGGITSSTAASASAGAHPTALAFAEASELGLSSYNGESFVGDALIILYTYSGDATMDGVVNTLDFNRLAANFGAGGADWVDGDFTYDNAVSSVDFSQLAANYGMTMTLAGGTLGAMIPEPGAMSAFTIISAAWTASRRLSRRR